MPLGDFLFGRPLTNEEEGEQKIGVGAGIPLLGIDALSSSAYGTEAALFVLSGIGFAALDALKPITALIVVLLFVLLLSYRQTIKAYPSGGGSYTVATENLGRMPGLWAASALLLDYILVVAIGASAGVGALVSAFPQLHPYIVPMSLALILLMTILNLRGVKESGVAFAIPVYGYLVILLGILFFGVFKAMQAGGNPVPLVEPFHPTKTGELGFLLILKGFASGCAALTGIEAVANGVPLFREPSYKRAQFVLLIVVVALSVIFACMAYLAKSYQVLAMGVEDGHYKSVMMQVVGAIVGNGAMYYTFLIFLLLLMALSANTAYAGFPRMCRLLARDDYLPHAFSARGRRLVYHFGIWTLTVCASILIIAFGGLLEKLLPLYAIGVFVAFTLSQAGMVHYNKKRQDKGKFWSMLVNGFGCFMTGAATLVVLWAKFFEGAWITLIVLPGFVFLFVKIKRHYLEVNRAISAKRPMDIPEKNMEVVVPIQRWNEVSERGLHFALTISDNIRVIHVADGESEEQLDHLKRDFDKYVREPLEEKGRIVPEFVIIKSPYRRIITPILEYIKYMRLNNPNKLVCVVIPELVEARWYQYFLHNQRAQALKAALLIQGENDIVVMNVPWYLIQHKYYRGEASILDRLHR